ncbi:hypothetical protein STCU_11456 [Strigomonas culicis]|uniref:Uncharacterized protein n=1 Tax=Strigomonas culicis TaxID=28005 RepID=S9TH45_9TRYP|nr:hypothetical protein STCU_11456 [Strigomonas culicis]|eukprot:EPY16239.1 hypothetical protein STCU_11456 [Strigomonas culicis]
MISEISSSTAATDVVGDPASVFCARPGWSSTSVEELDGWKRAQCNCVSGTYGPYCLPIVDPVLYYMNYNAVKPNMSEKSGMSTALLVGAIAGPIGLLLVVLAVILVVCCCCRKKNQENDSIGDSDTNSEMYAAYQTGCRVGSMYSGKILQGPMSFHSNNPLDVLSRHNSQHSMSFCNGDPLTELSRNTSQREMSYYNEGIPAPVAIWTSSQGPISCVSDGPMQQYGEMELQQMQPRGSFILRPVSGGHVERQFSSNQIQYVDLESNGAYHGYN